MWERKEPAEFVKTTEKAVKRIAEKKIESINQTADWMKKYLYSEWPKNPDKVEIETKSKVLAALAEEMKQEPAYTAWVLYQMAGELTQHLEVKAIWE